MANPDYFDPFIHNGRWIGRWIGASGERIERLGIWIQNWAAWLRWRRFRRDATA